jgi:hypothetical protein
MHDAPPGLVDERPRASTIQLLQRAETRSERVAAAVAEIICPDCNPLEYLVALEAAIERSWRRGICDHDRYVPTARGMAAMEVGG